MFKRLLKEKKYVLAMGAIAFAALSAIVIYMLTEPAHTVEADEATVVETEQHEPETAGDTAIETEDSQDENPAYLETEEPEKSNIQETVEETEEIAGGEPEENSKDKPNEKEEGEDSPKQTKYTGRQPPEGYVEPKGDKNYVPRLLEYKDTYQSNIVVFPEEIRDIDHRDYAWFHPTSPYFREGWETYQFLVYAILTYYDGDIPCDYYVNKEEDMHNIHPKTTTIFEIQMHGDRPLNICLDLYNYKIYVEEGIVEKRGLTRTEWIEQQYD